MFSKKQIFFVGALRFIYPLYYVAAMLVATLIIAPLKGGAFEGAKAFFRKGKRRFGGLPNGAPLQANQLRGS